MGSVLGPNGDGVTPPTRANQVSFFLFSFVSLLCNSIGREAYNGRQNHILFFYISFLMNNRWIMFLWAPRICLAVVLISSKRCKSTLAPTHFGQVSRVHI